MYFLFNIWIIYSSTCRLVYVRIGTWAMRLYECVQEFKKYTHILYRYYTLLKKIIRACVCAKNWSLENEWICEKNGFASTCLADLLSGFGVRFSLVRSVWTVANGNIIYILVHMVINALHIYTIYRTLSAHSLTQNHTYAVGLIKKSNHTRGTHLFCCCCCMRQSLHRVCEIRALVPSTELRSAQPLKIGRDCKQEKRFYKLTHNSLTVFTNKHAKKLWRRRAADQCR